MNQKLDLIAMRKRSYEVLCQELIPLHYNELYDRTVTFIANSFYSDKTVPREKFRQFVSNEKLSCNHQFAYIKKYGLVGLPHWFDGNKYELPFITEDKCISIQRDSDISFLAMKELIYRIPFMKDHYNDADKLSRQDRRINAYLVESHISHFFKNKYPAFFKNPINYGIFEKPSTMDFFLNYNNGKNEILLPIDVKSFFYAKHEIFSAVRKNKDSLNTIYVFGTLKDEFVVIDGFRRGKDLFKVLSLTNGTIKVKRHYLLPIDILLVYLNIIKKGLNYPELIKNRHI